MPRPTDNPGGQAAPAPADSPPRSWRTRFQGILAVLLATAFLALLALGLLIKSPDDSIDQALSEGRSIAAPGFELPVLAGGELPRALAERAGPALSDGSLALDELRGLPVVINFWASWCNPCREEASQLEAAWRKAASEGVLFLGLNMQDLSDDARAFLDEFGSTYPIVRDQADAVAGDWGVTGLPETFFISADGLVVSHIIGVASSEQLRTGVEAAKRGVPANAIAGGPQGATR